MTIRLGKTIFWAAIALIAVTTGIAAVEWGRGDNDALHTTAAIAGIFGIAVAVGWFTLLIASVVLMVARIVRYSRAHITVPTLLWRDLVTKTGLAAPFSLVIVVRLLTSSATATTPLTPLMTYVPWLIWTSVPPLLGMGTFLFFEAFIIDQWQGTPR